MANTYRYSLSNSGPKTTCPRCGRTKCFKPYKDNETGEILNPEVGRCDHEQSCKYHYSPHDYFRDHPDEKEAKRMDRYTGANLKPISRIEVTPPYVQTEYFDPIWVKRSMERKSTFSEWFRSLPYDAKRKEQVLQEYGVGGTAYDIVRGGINYGPAVIFWMIDEQQRIHDAKLMAYRNDGHRMGQYGDSMRSICKNKGVGPQLEQTEKVLFGLHLIAFYPEKTICIVESEKTALVCACHYPEYLWMASGGCGNLKADKLRPLMDKNVVVYPDSGELDKWQMRMHESGHQHYHVVDYLERFEANTDIADILLHEAKLKSEIVNEEAVSSTPLTPWQQMKCEFPYLQLLEDGLDLVEIR